LILLVILLQLNSTTTVSYSEASGAQQEMGNSYRVRIGLREIQAMQPNTILWDFEVNGFVARRQFWDARAKHLKTVR
jgi:hypothetical protein